MDTKRDILFKYLQGKFGILPPTIFDEILAPDYVEHQPSMVRGVSQAKEFAKILVGGFPDQHFEVKDEIVYEEKVVMRYEWNAVNSGDFMKWPATHKKIETHGIMIARVVGIRMVESWEEWDFAGFVGQLEDRQL